MTSHCPCGIYKERIDKLNPFDYKLMRNQIDKLEELDRYAFERADYIIFPCKDAEEPYFNTWPRYTSIRKDEKYRYMPTGIIACHAKINRENYRKNMVFRMTHLSYLMWGDTMKLKDIQI